MTDQKAEILTALAQLDPHSDEDWTKQGLPALEAVNAYAGIPVTRALVNSVAPKVTRANPYKAPQAPQGGEDEQPDAQVPGDDAGAQDEPESADPREALRARIAEINDTVSALQGTIEKARRDITQLEAEADKLHAQLVEGQDPPHIARMKRHMEELNAANRRRQDEATLSPLDRARRAMPRVPIPLKR